MKTLTKKENPTRSKSNCKKPTIIEQPREEIISSNINKTGLFPKPPVIERVETKAQKKEREIQAQTMEVQRSFLRQSLERRISVAQEEGNGVLLNQLLKEWGQI